MYKNVNVLTLLQENLGDVRQVIFALLIGRLYLREGIEELAGIKAVNTRVDFLDLPFLGAGVLLFNDAREFIVSAANLCGRSHSDFRGERSGSNSLHVVYDDD